MEVEVMGASSSLLEGRNSQSLSRFGVPWPEMNDGLFYKDTVKPGDSGMSLIEFYSSKYRDSAPKEGWVQRIQNGQIKVDGQVVTNSDSILRLGSNLLYHRLPWKEPDVPYMVEVLFEDDHVLAINKPSGLQVLPGGSFQQRTVFTQLCWRTYGPFSTLPEKYSEQKQHSVPVHRLGRGTSGILLCAKTKLAKVQLAGYFADGASALTDDRSHRHIRDERVTRRRISKVYRGLATGILEKDQVTIDQPIGRITYPGVAKGLYVACSSGKPAESKVVVLERDLGRNCTLVQVEISSGRPHQIRIHLSFIGHPLLDDPLYGIGGIPKCSLPELRDERIALDGGYCRPTKPIPGDCGYHLHAYQLIFAHPVTNKVIKLTARLPALLQTQQEHNCGSKAEELLVP
ncbi:RNA pseudouridine synthase 5 [Nymphaea colorata]|nr:RNA pseudouridine synthase 5 [Nymphaea colorata]